MGLEFNFARLCECHRLCSMDVYNALSKGKNCFVDNTNMKVLDRAMYHLLARHFNVKLIVFTIVEQIMVIN